MNMSSENWISDHGSSSNNTATTAPNINSSTSSNSSLRIPHNNCNDNIIDPMYSPTTCSSYNQFLPSDDDYFSTFDPRINDFLLTTNNNSPSFSPSSDDFNFDNLSEAIATQNRLNQASFILDNHHLINSYSMGLSTLHKSIKQVHALRQENETLRQANTDLINRLNLLSQANCLISSSSSIKNEFSSRRLTTARDGRFIAKTSASPTSVIQQNNIDNRNHHKFSLPKSISVRSSNYEKTSQRGESTRNMNTNTNQQRVTTAPSPNEPRRRLYEDEALEFDMEVYNQGMQKTELCNKWQETGECPYGGKCRFAHGISELRPVIRHPRYKTEICRMFLSGNMCPYGHRCHFRHSAIDQE